jgi:hypothetical protein
MLRADLKAKIEIPVSMESAVSTQTERWTAVNPPRVILLLAVAATLVVDAVMVYFDWRYDLGLNHVAGAWVALASDFKDGVFYRGLFGPLGYGNTIYFPLHFIMQGVVYKLLGGPILSGHIVDVAAMAALLAAVYVVLCRRGVDRGLAGLATLLLLSGEATRYALLTIREDALALALSIWGIAVLAKPSLRNRDLAFAAVLFSAAVAAKQTSVFGLTAALLWLALSGRYRTAAKLAAFFSLGIAVTVLAMQIGSGGRAFEVLTGSSVPGITLHNFLLGPFRALHYASLGLIVFGVLAWAALLGSPPHEWRGIIPLFLITTTAGEAAIFAWGGADFNHLIDFEVVAVLMVATRVARQGGPAFESGLAALALAGLLSLAPALRTLRAVAEQPPENSLVQAASFVARSHAPALCQNPLVCILAGQRPYMLDSTTFSLVRTRNRSFAAPLFDGLDNQRFGSVVLMVDPRTAKGAESFNSHYFGKGFLQHLGANYQFATELPGAFIYVPKT